MGSNGVPVQDEHALLSDVLLNEKTSDCLIFLLCNVAKQFQQVKIDQDFDLETSIEKKA